MKVEDWSHGWARRRRRQEATGPEEWGEYETPEGPVRLYRGAHNRCRFYGPEGQVGPEQMNVVPAMAMALYAGWSLRRRGLC